MEALNQFLSLPAAAHTQRAAEETETCFLLYSRSLRRYVITLVGDGDLAGEVVQEAFFRLFACLREGQNIGNYRAWLASACRNIAVDEWRRQRHTDSLGPLEPDHADCRPTIEAEMVDREQVERLEHLLPMLSPPARQCVELRMKGLRLKEIGERLGISTSAVAVELTRSADRLRRLQALSR